MARCLKHANTHKAAAAPAPAAVAGSCNAALPFTTKYACALQAGKRLYLQAFNGIFHPEVLGYRLPGAARPLSLIRLTNPLVIRPSSHLGSTDVEVQMVTILQDPEGITFKVNASVLMRLDQYPPHAPNCDVACQSQPFYAYNLVFPRALKSMPSPTEPLFVCAAPNDTTPDSVHCQSLNAAARHVAEFAVDALNAEEAFNRTITLVSAVKYGTRAAADDEATAGTDIFETLSVLGAAANATHGRLVQVQLHEDVSNKLSLVAHTVLQPAF